jgi:predicted ArsR family transcriptional regulator
VTALADESRRTLYDYVRRQDHPVSREDAAEATGMSRNLVAFHLDKLVDAGLLSARSAPPRGRGRAPKVYEAAADGLALTIPERRYELVAEILADAVADRPRDAGAAAREHARRRGETLAAEVTGTGLDDVLAGLGYEPERPDATTVRLRNCPFHVLAARQTALVCGLNHAFLDGLVGGLGLDGTEARLEPRPGACCVEVVEAPAPGRARPAEPGPRPTG